jgi:hypothetical protein
MKSRKSQFSRKKDFTVYFSLAASDTEANAMHQTRRWSEGVAVLNLKKKGTRLWAKLRVRGR